jgi:hypothetical protein
MQEAHIRFSENCENLPRFLKIKRLSVAVISFKKRSFRKYFQVEANNFEFDRLIHSVLQAPTLKIAGLLQESIVDWLESVKEYRAVK